MNRMASFDPTLFKKDEAVFDPADFRPLRLEARVRDLANANGALIEILEFQGQRIVADGPGKFTAAGQTIVLTLLLQNRVPFTATARTVVVDPLGGTRARITLELVQYDKSGLSKIEEVFLERQRRIGEFMKAAKGH